MSSGPSGGVTTQPGDRHCKRKADQISSDEPGPKKQATKRKRKTSPAKSDSVISGIDMEGKKLQAETVPTVPAVLKTST